MNKLCNLLPLLLIVLILAIIARSTPKINPSSQSIVIGSVMPLTGAIASAGGEGGKQGMQLAVDEINQTGGIKGHKIEFIAEDSKSNNIDGLNAFINLITTKNPSVILTIGSGLNLSIAPVAKEYQLPVLATITTSYKVTQQNDFMFRYYDNSEQEMKPLVTTLEQKQSKKIGVLYLEDDAFLAMLDVLKKNYKGEVVTESFQSSGTDYRTQLAKLKANSPDSLVVLGFLGQTTNAIKQAKELGFANAFYTSSIGALPEMQAFTKEQSVTLYVGAPKIYGDAVDEKVIALRQRYEDQTHQPFNQYVAAGYDSIQLLTQVMPHSGTQPDQIKKGLNETKEFKGLLGPVQISTREFNFPLYPAEVRDGQVNFIFEN